MKYVEGQDRAQPTLLPDCIDDLVHRNNPVRVIDAFAEGLDLSEAGFMRAMPNDMGRPPYNPRDLLKLYIYGYFNKIRSSRKLMAECTRNIELFYLLNRLTPDFRTISDFRKDNAKAIKNVFRAFVKICMKLGLYQKELLAVDGSKFRAVNSKENTYNVGILQKKLSRIDEHIEDYLARLDKADESEPDEETMAPGQVEAAVRGLKEQKEKYQGYLKELEDKVG
jgi:transposase